LQQVAVPLATVVVVEDPFPVEEAQGGRRGAIACLLEAMDDGLPLLLRLCDKICFRALETTRPGVR
jgi:hypothetical protein